MPIQPQNLLPIPSKGFYLFRSVLLNPIRERMRLRLSSRRSRRNVSVVPTVSNAVTPNVLVIQIMSNPNGRFRNGRPIRKYFRKSEEFAVQIPCLLRYKTKPPEEERNNSFSGGIFFCEISNLRFEVKLSQMTVKFLLLGKSEVKFASKRLRSKLHYGVTSLPQGNFTCP